MQKKMPNNCVIIGDIKESRNLNNWQNVFKELEKTLTEINGKFSNIIVVNFTPTVGDEFQGSIAIPETAIEIYNFIRSRLQVNIYCGIGIGNIEKPFTNEMGMRGTAFYRAREALDLCKKIKRNIFIKSADVANLTDNTINTLLYFIEVLENSWTKRQREIASYYRLHPDYTHEQLSTYFNVSRQTITKCLKSTHWEVIKQGESIAKAIIKGNQKWLPK